MHIVGSQELLLFIFLSQSKIPPRYVNTTVRYSNALLLYMWTNGNRGFGTVDQVGVDVLKVDVMVLPV